jgi:hypothetical protein
MRRILLFSILIFFLLFSGACKSKPAPQVNAPTNTNPPASVPPTNTNTTPPVNAPDNTTTTTNNPNTSPGNIYGGTTDNYSNRHSTGVILDRSTNYSVIKGDTLSDIARKLYRDGSMYPLIMMVSGVIVDPDKILPLQQFVIPDVNINMNDPTARQSINRYFLQIADIEDQRGRHQTATLIRNHTK